MWNIEEFEGEKDKRYFELHPDTLGIVMHVTPEERDELVAKINEQRYRPGAEKKIKELVEKMKKAL